MRMYLVRFVSFSFSSTAFNMTSLTKSQKTDRFYFRTNFFSRSLGTSERLWGRGSVGLWLNWRMSELVRQWIWL